MSSFTSDLIIKPLDDGCCWILIEPFEYSVGDLESNDKIVIPKGFITDFASVPKVLWNIFPPWGIHGKAAVLHDYLYKRQGRARVVCDAIFLEAMEVLSVGLFTRWIMYLSVRFAGWMAWREHTRNNTPTAESPKPEKRNIDDTHEHS